MYGFVVGGNTGNEPPSKVMYWASSSKFRSNVTVEGLALLLLHTVLLNSRGKLHNILK
jgi:hypothetical protein